MAKKTNEPFDPSAWLNEAPATKEEKREKRKAEREEKKKESDKKAKIPKKKKRKENDNKFNLKYVLWHWQAQELGRLFLIMGTLNTMLN